MARHLSLIPALLAGGAALALTALPAAAHPSMHGCDMGMGMGGQGPTINVQGEGRASVAPDLATVSLGVTTQAPTAAQAMADNAARQTAVIEALRAQGIAPADLQTQGLSLSPMQDYSREGQPPVITGYQAQNIVTARVRDLARLGPLLDTMVTAGATDVQGISFSREDAAATEDRARTGAVAEARRRAEVIAEAAGMELGPLVSLTDTSFSDGPRPLAMMARAADAEASTPVQTGELTLTAQVTGVWSLIQAGGEAGDCGPRGRHGQEGHHGDHGKHGHHGARDRGNEGPNGHPERHGMMPRDGDDRRDAGRAEDRGPAPDASSTEWQLAPAPQPVPPSGAPQAGGAALKPAGDTAGSTSAAPVAPAAVGTASGGAAGAGSDAAPSGASEDAGTAAAGTTAPAN